MLVTALLFIAAMRHTTDTGSALLHSRSMNARGWARISPHLPTVTAGLDGFAALLRNALAATERLQRQAKAVPSAANAGAAPAAAPACTAVRIGLRAVVQSTCGRLAAPHVCQVAGNTATGEHACDCRDWSRQARQDAAVPCQRRRPEGRLQRRVARCTCRARVLLGCLQWCSLWADAGPAIAHAHHCGVPTCAAQEQELFDCAFLLRAISQGQQTGAGCCLTTHERRSERRVPCVDGQPVRTRKRLSLCCVYAQGRTITAPLRRGTRACGSSSSWAAAGALPAPTAARGRSPTPSSCPAAPSRCAARSDYALSSMCLSGLRVMQSLTTARLTTRPEPNMRPCASPHWVYRCPTACLH